MLTTQPFWRLVNALKEFMDLLLQAKRESDPRSQIMIFRRAKSENGLCNILQRAKKMRFPVGKMVGEEGFEPPTNGV